MDFSEIQVVKLSKVYDVEQFDCGDSDINDFLINDALAYQNNNVAVTMLFIYHEQIIGFYSLSADSIRLNGDERDSDDHLAGKRVPEIPAVKIGRLGRHKLFSQQNVGSFILKRAIGHIMMLSNSLGVRFVTVDAYPHKMAWYKQFGFVPNEHKHYTKKDNHVSMRYCLLLPRKPQTTLLSS